jgi:hypothetical protein
MRWENKYRIDGSSRKTPSIDARNRMENHKAMQNFRLYRCKELLISKAMVVDQKDKSNATYEDGAEERRKNSK